MKKVFTVLAVAALTALAALPVFAQATTDSLGSLSSNTSLTTSGLFKNDVDNFINYHKYSGVLAGDAKLFGFVTGRDHSKVGSLLDAGFASSFGSLYLGVWYRGNIFRVNDETVTTTITPTWDDNREVLLETLETTAYSKPKWQESANQIEFLVGVAGQGIKVGFLESYASDQNGGNRDYEIKDYQDGRKDYSGAVTNYERSQGYLKPYLGWGTNIAVSDMNLMPYVDLGLTIYGDKLVDNYQSYREVNGVKQNVTGTVGEGNNSGYLQPYGVIGAKLDLAKKDTSVTQLELKYGIDLRLYDNSYGATGLSGSAGGTVSWAEGYVNRITDYPERTDAVTDITLNIDEKSYIKHTITPTYKITGEPGENFKLGFSASVPVTITSMSNLGYTEQYTISKSSYKADNSMNTEIITKTRTYDDTKVLNTKTSDFNIKLNLNLGASYKLIPNRFTINAGIGATPASYTSNVERRSPNHINSVTTKEITDGAGNKTEEKTVEPATGKNNDDTVIVTNTWTQWSANLFGGFVFQFNNNFSLDLLAGVNGFNINLTTVNVIFTFKY